MREERERERKREEREGGVGEGSHTQGPGAREFFRKGVVSVRNLPAGGDWLFGMWLGGWGSVSLLLVACCLLSFLLVTVTGWLWLWLWLSHCWLWLSGLLSLLPSLLLAAANHANPRNPTKDHEIHLGKHPNPKPETTNH